MQEEIEEINKIICDLNKEYHAANEQLTTIRQEYHLYHILEEECPSIANNSKTAAEYFQNVYIFCNSLRKNCN